MSRQLRSPQVMLLIDTSSVYGRELIEGIGRYAADMGLGRSTTKTGACSIRFRPC